MSYPVKLKQEFLKKWMTGLKECTSNSKKNNMSVMERKNAIKISADLAMASARYGSSSWSRAFISNASKDDDNRNIVQQILGPHRSELPQKCPLPSSKMCNKMIRCKKILRRSHSVGRGAKHKVQAKSIAKRLVKKRTQLLKSLVPGGECMNEVSLIKEALDYIVSLQAQVDVMRCIATASELECQN